MSAPAPVPLPAASPAAARAREPEARPGVGPEARAAQPVRWPIAVVVSRFPLITETFILREVIELERQGQPVRLVPLVREAPAVVHREAVPWVDRALYLPFVSRDVLAANLRLLRRGPARYMALLGRTLAGVARSPNLLARTAALLPKAAGMAERLSREDVRHIHAHFATHPTTAAMVASGLAGLEYSFTVHAHDIFVRRALLEPKLRGARLVRLISDYNRRYLEDRYPGALGDRARVIHVGIDPSGYGRPQPDANDRATADPRLLCVAAFKEYKGIPVLLEACSLLARREVRFRCDLVGDGPLRPRIERGIRELGLGDVVRVHGAVPQDAVTGLLRLASVLVLPSVIARDGQMEGIPVALMEAMASGLPVVASSLSGIPELVRHEWNGLLVPPGDVPALAAALQRLLGDPGLALSLGDRGRATVHDSFRLDGCVSQLLAELDRVVPTPDTALAEEVRAAAHAIGHRGGIGIRRVQERPDSRVVELMLAGGPAPRELVLKTQRTRSGESAPGPARARHEFETLRRLHEAFSAAGPGDAAVSRDPVRRPGVPRPLHLDGGRASVLMERCPGTALDDRVRAGRRGGGDVLAGLERDVRDAAAWLEGYHAQTRLKSPADPHLYRLLETATTDVGRSGLFGRSGARRLVDRLERLRDAVDPAALRVVERHGDYWPGNIYVSSDAVTVIDFEGARPGLDYEDVAGFLAELAPFLAFPVRAGARTALKAAFLARYFADRAVDAPALELCRSAAALAALALDRERERTRGSARFAPGPWGGRRTLIRLALGADR
jgi:colanic acid/amylovoran biosynthesis glycosyltransferase